MLQLPIYQVLWAKLRIFIFNEVQFMQRILNDLSISNRQLLIAMLIVLGMLLLSLLVGLFICLAINEDGKALGVKDRKIYAVLGFFFPAITAIVYLIIRKKTEKIQPKMCNNCGLTVPPSINCCPQCGCMDFTDYLIVDNNKHKKRAKCFAVIGVVLYVIMFSFGTLSQFENLFNISNFDGDKIYNYDNDYQYEYDYDDCLNQYGE